MIRKRVAKRPDWKEKFEEAGFSFHSMDGEYWREGICYEFTSEQIDYLDDITGELHEMCLAAVDHVVRHDRWDDLSIPQTWRQAITDSWNRRDPSLYGRFDFAYNGEGPAKLLEYNADTPTSLYESSIAQWLWLEEAMPRMDQFNSIHEKLLKRYEELPAARDGREVFHFSAISGHQEDLVTVEYLRDVATQTGFTTKLTFIEDIGYDTAGGTFVDDEGLEIRSLFKLYPLEWMLAEEFGGYLMAQRDFRLYEPFWKIILSNKGILAILWQLYPDHPNLLPASLTEPRNLSKFVRKPVFSREGANIQICSGEGVLLDSGGTYSLQSSVYQEYCELPRHDGFYTLIGSWVVGDEPAGLGIREDTTVITKNTSMFVPHYFVP